MSMTLLQHRMHLSMETSLRWRQELCLSNEWCVYTYITETFHSGELKKLLQMYALLHVQLSHSVGYWTSIHCHVSFCRLWPTLHPASHLWSTNCFGGKYWHCIAWTNTELLCTDYEGLSKKRLPNINILQSHWSWLDLIKFSSCLQQTSLDL